MSDLLVPGGGGILSADIAVPEHEREVRFYSRVLSTGENPLWREDLMNNLGMPIIGLGARSAGYAHPLSNGCHTFRSLMSPPVWSVLWIWAGVSSCTAKTTTDEPVGGAARSERGSVRDHASRFCGRGPPT